MRKKDFYKDFDATDFINDEYFQNWILKSGEEEVEEFWYDFLEMYPEKEGLIMSSKATLEKIPFEEVIAERAPGNEKIKTSFLQVSKILGLKGEKVNTPVIPISRWWAAAASVLIILSAGYFFLTNKNDRQIAKMEQSSKSLGNLIPGGNKAILTLGNGEIIILDSVDNGTLSLQGGSTIMKLGDGQIAYEGSAHSIQTEIVYNTISTPAGGQYNLTLSDGSKVWLNAESSLRFPATFSGNERNVELTGEGYFEIAHNKEKPFHVSVNNTRVEVLGTHFNINAYADENALKTTLLEGSVKVIKGSQNVIIEPGQQAAVNNTSNSITIDKSVNLEEVVAWKEGIFQFDNTDLQEVMRQLGRWYNVKVDFEKNVPAKHFTGKIYRNVNASEVFKILEVLDIHFKVKGNTVIVTK